MSEPQMDKIEKLEQRIEELEAKQSEDDEERKKLSIIATKGTLDMAYPPLILATTAASFGWDVQVFYTFWGLDVLHEEKSDNLEMSAVGNPSMPMPNSIAALPFGDKAVTKMMEHRMSENGTPSVRELIDTALDMDVELLACQMTMELMDYTDDELIDGVKSGVGAATALNFMGEADVQLML
ncbi:DsrE/DsrF/DrsH-like family protein [Candidatus Nanohalococcus occultus]|uniref:Peroxiredoxin family protein n=1 Tax=Candidatus Nanohalococcus occultus TaxID=2978047 RepID=A0ABY8CI82_9ARCH|nr:Peroxiredoxin family protein [Candidatus Nanohaloarchaeota archaeon SVXNc]